mmetsp:Transcript_26192/g.26080  ORF Transcript_26192/g.26080 Transcript_26192/m.26080 type:complete len:102 (+) Transcript_26192:840-1145(+)
MIVDNSMVSFMLNLESAIPIESYQGNKQDTELYKLVEIMATAISSTSSNSDKALDSSAQFKLNLRDYIASVYRMEDRFSFWRHQMNNGFEDVHYHLQANLS